MISGDIRPPRFAKAILERTTRSGNRDSVMGDLEEEFIDIAGAEGLGRARRWYARQAAASIVPFILGSLLWNISLAGNYLKLAGRSLRKNRGYSLLNIVGLSAGIACCIFIFLFVDLETSYDSFHPDADRVFRLARSRKTPAKHDLVAMVYAKAAPIMKERFSEIEVAARAHNLSYRYARVDGKTFMHDRIITADQEIFDLMRIPFMEGDAGSALSRPNTAVITRSLSEKYFGDLSPVGRTVLIDTTAYEVTGVIADCPANTHLKYDMIVKYVFVEVEWHRPWRGPNLLTYIKLSEGVDPAAFEEKIRFLPHEYIGEYLEEMGTESTLFLQPIESIHLDSNLTWEAEPPGNRMYVVVFTIIGAFILLISCMNFMNLTTARTAGRALEVGVRKVSGANRGQLVWQFLGESILISTISVLLAAAIVVTVLPSFNIFFEFDFTAGDVLSPRMIMFFLSMVIVAGIAGGAYSAFVLSSFRPIVVMKGSIREGARGLTMRKLLVIGQFSISTALIAGTLIFNQQLDYMKNKYPGWDRDQKLVVEFNRNIIKSAESENIKAAFLNHPSIRGGTFTSSVPSRWMYRWHLHPAGEQDTKDQLVNAFGADGDFFDLFGIEFIAGGSFGEPGKGNGCVINRAAMRSFGWNEPEEALEHAIIRAENPIVGVIEDYHFRGLQEPVEPLYIFNFQEDFRFLTLDIDIEDVEGVLSHIASTHEVFFPQELYEHFFMDEEFGKQYRTDEQRARLFLLFACFGVAIGCLGLFGLSSYLTQQRTKEVGVRKVFGASLYDIFTLMSKEFLKWVLLSNIVAWPLAYLIMEKFLRDFSARIEIGPAPFVLAGSSALLVAALTVSYQALKAGMTDPADSLKYE